MRLILVRHALTDQTGAHLTGWTPGVHLSDTGRSQADDLAARLAVVPLDTVYSSPIDRCRETAAPIAKAQGLKVRRDKRFGEVGYGDWTGEAIGKLARTNLWQRVQYRPSLAAFPNGESIVGAQQRIVGGIEALRTTEAGNVAVCSHADMIKLAVAHYAGIHIDLYQRLVIAPVSVTALRFDDAVGVQIELLNDVGSLASFAPDKKASKRRQAYRQWGHA